LAAPPAPPPGYGYIQHPQLGWVLVAVSAPPQGPPPGYGGVPRGPVTGAPPPSNVIPIRGTNRMVRPGRGAMGMPGDWYGQFLASVPELDLNDPRVAHLAAGLVPTDDDLADVMNGGEYHRAPPANPNTPMSDDPASDAFPRGPVEAVARDLGGNGGGGGDAA
jgi:hypothetical protein